MKKFVIIFKMEPISENQKTRDHTIEADGIETTDQHTLQLFRYNYRKNQDVKEIVAIYSMDHVICAVESD